MRMQFIPDGAVDTPLILITCERPQDAAALSEALRQTAGGPVELHRLPGVEAVDGLVLVAHSARKDLGVRRGAGVHFDWSLSQSGWDDVGELLAPFTRPDRSGFQYLNEHGGPNVIISTDGHW